MSYKLFENDDLRRLMFTYLRTPCEYKKPPHYQCMKSYCVGIDMIDMCGSDEERLVLNPLFWRLKMANQLEYNFTAVKEELEQDMDTLGECLQDMAEGEVGYFNNEELEEYGYLNDFWDLPITICEYI